MDGGHAGLPELSAACVGCVGCRFCPSLATPKSASSTRSPTDYVKSDDACLTSRSALLSQSAATNRSLTGGVGTPLHLGTPTAPIPDLRALVGQALFIMLTEPALRSALVYLNYAYYIIILKDAYGCWSLTVHGKITASLCIHKSGRLFTRNSTGASHNPFSLYRYNPFTPGIHSKHNKHSGRTHGSIPHGAYEHNGRASINRSQSYC